MFVVLFLVTAAWQAISTRPKLFLYIGKDINADRNPGFRLSL